MMSLQSKLSDEKPPGGGVDNLLLCCDSYKVSLHIVMSSMLTKRTRTHCCPRFRKYTVTAKRTGTRGEQRAR